MFRNFKILAFFAMMIFLIPSVQGMFLPNPFFDAPSYLDTLEEGPYWRELINVDMPLRKYDQFISNIIATSNGDLLFVGTDSIYQGYNEEGVSEYSRHGYIARMTKDGQLVWESLIGDGLEFFDCEEVGDDRYLVLGRDINNDKNQVVLLAFDENGTVLWKRTIESETDDSAFRMAWDGGTNVYLAGFSDTDEGYDGLFIKIDTEGNVIWKKTYDDGDHEVFTEIALSSDGNVVLVGTKKRLEFLPITTHLYSQALVVSCNAQGDLRWAVSQGFDGDYTVPTDLEIGSDGTIAITGRVIYGEMHDILSMLMDLDGNLIDCKSYPGLYEYDDYGYDIIELEPGTFFVFGESFRIIVSEKDPMLWWYVSDSFYSRIDENGEIELVSTFFGDAPASSMYRSTPHSSCIDQDGRIFLIMSSWGDYEVYTLSLLGDSIIILDKIAGQEFPSWRENLIN